MLGLWIACHLIHALSSFQATVNPVAGFDAEEDCKKMRKAMKGLGK